MENTQNTTLIAIKFPQENFQFQCPLKWTIAHIIQFTNKHYKNHKIPPNKMLKLYLAGRELEDGEVLNEVLSRRNMQLQKVPTFLVGEKIRGNSDGDELEHMRHSLYAKYFENVECMDSQFRGNFDQRLLFFPSVGVKADGKHLIIKDLVSLISSLADLNHQQGQQQQQQQMNQLIQQRQQQQQGIEQFD